ncbi:depupylase/deamidase Dop [Rothia nasisuis]|uniref:depupylase/deamidase Dop n=1 Tax=Rothia nasisuis TaxID=2109647 RepID=UPI001F030BD2|nr:depupylase/deamidase Dop [Rothia nasisuis]
MTVQRVMGAETEYGVFAPSKPSANPVVLSAFVVNTYDALFKQKLASRAQTEWEYGSESPLADARGFELAREAAHPSQLTDTAHVLTSEDIAAEALSEAGLFAERIDWDSVTMNSILPNGARFYVDHAHPEYSSPEVTNPRDAVLWDAAGDFIAAQTVAAIEQVATEPATSMPAVNLYKNNTDGKGQSYGSHENYLVTRSVDFEYLAAALLPFFATRQIMVGAGRVGLGVAGEQAGFQLSQRADFFERTVGLETTIRRPLVNTRDEPHADPARYRRLHVITGDANLSHYSNLLKFGTMSLVLNLVEAGAVPTIKLADPVAAMHTVSHDLSLTAELPLATGGTMTALQIQRAYLAAAQQLEKTADAATVEVLGLWHETLYALEHDLFSLADRLDWVAKYALMSSYVAKGSSWGDSKLAAIDLQYSDVRPQKSLYHKLVALGRMKTLFSQEQVADAATHPPRDTRAYLRGRLITTWPDEVVGANWDTLSVRNPLSPDLVRIHMDDPLAYTAEQVDPHLGLPHADQLLALLSDHT